MKKLFAAALLSCAIVGATTSQASAWGCWRCCNSCYAKICVRPYNAFTPTCFGTITCIGCNPVNFGGPMGGMGPACGGGSCGPSCYSGCDGGYLGTLPPPAPGSRPGFCAPHPKPHQPPPPRNAP